MKHFFFLSISIAVLPLGCFNKATPIQSITKDEYDIYSVVLDSLLTVDNHSEYILQDSTIRNRFSHTRRGFKFGRWLNINDLDRLNYPDSIWIASDNVELTHYYESINQLPALINSGDIKTKFNIHQLAKDSLISLFSSGPDNGWDVFYKHYPRSGGILFLSRVGFNNRFDQGVLYVELQQASLSAEGLYFLLYKLNSTWRIKATAVCWQS